MDHCDDHDHDHWYSKIFHKILPGEDNHNLVKKLSLQINLEKEREMIEYII